MFVLIFMLLLSLYSLKAAVILGAVILAPALIMFTAAGILGLYVLVFGGK